MGQVKRQLARSSSGRIRQRPQVKVLLVGLVAAFASLLMTGPVHAQQSSTGQADLILADAPGGHEGESSGPYVVFNNGPDDAAGPITLTIPAQFVSASGIGWTCSAAGETITCVYASGLAAGESTTVTVTIRDCPGDSRVSSPTPDPNQTNNTARGTCVGGESGGPTAPQTGLPNVPGTPSPQPIAADQPAPQVAQPAPQVAQPAPQAAQAAQPAPQAAQPAPARAVPARRIAVTGPTDLDVMARLGGSLLVLGLALAYRARGRAVE